MVAHQVSLVTIIAELNTMMLPKLLPVAHLGNAQGPCAVTDRAGITQGGEHRLSNEIGPVTNSSEGLGQFLIYLKGNYLFLSLTPAGHSAPPTLNF